MCRPAFSIIKYNTALNLKAKVGHSLKWMELIFPVLRPLRLVFISSGVIAARINKGSGSGPLSQRHTRPLQQLYSERRGISEISLKTFSRHSRTPPAASSSDDL